MQEAAMEKHETIERPEVKTTVEARQGDQRRMNLRVLLISLLIAIVLLAALYAFVYPFPE
jgi:hypothetical protein